MRIFDIFFKNIKEISRDKHNLFFILIFPAISLLIFGLLFSGGLINETADIAVVDLDHSDYSASLINNLSSIKLTDDDNIFNIIYLDTIYSADKKLEEGSISSYIVIPENYSQNIESMIVNGNSNSILIKGNPTSMQYIITKSVLDIVLIDYSINLQKDYYNSSFNTVNLEVLDNNEFSNYNTFNYLLPGLIVFGLLMTINSITLNLSREFENGMLKRMKLTKMTSKDYVIGNLLTWLLIGIAQVIILILIAIVIGFEWNGGIYTFILSSLIGILTMMSSIAIAIIIVSLTKTSAQSSALATIISFSLSFLAESSVLLQDMSSQYFSFMPWSQAVDALNQILMYNRNIFQISSNIVYILISGIVLLLIAIILFNKKINADLINQY